MKIRITEDRPVALYDADKRKLIGVFQSPCHAAKYCLPPDKNKKGNQMHYALHRKSRIKQTAFGFPIAARYANDLQERMLDDELYCILDGYPKPDENQLKGFTATKESMYKDSAEKISSYGQAMFAKVTNHMEKKIA